MRTLKTLKPGAKGTKELLARYGTSLLRVRYRYDEATGQHLKTVELVVGRRRHTPGLRVGREAPSPGRVSGVRQAPPRATFQARPPARRTVALRIHWRESELRRRVKSAGARWDPDGRVWLLRRDQAERLSLLHRIVGG